MATPSVILKTVAAAATPEALGTTAQVFHGIVFLGYKGDATTANTGTVYVQLKELDTDGTLGSFADAIPIPSGGYSAALNVSMMGVSELNAAQFQINVDNDGDGVVAVVTR